MISAAQPLVVGLGEALYDCFPNKRVLGGAPLNVAVHAHALLETIGGAAAPATRVGVDELGDEVVRTLRQRGVGIDWVQRDPDRLTGRVTVAIDDRGDASYEFQANSAWDAIEMTPDFERLAQHSDAVAFGSLAQRSDASRRAIQQFLRAADKALRLFDVNLRQDFYSESTLRESLQLATAVKVNEEELGVLTRLLGEALPVHDGLEARAIALRSAFDLEWVAVTRGPKGVAMATPTGWHEGVEPLRVGEPSANADTVGAGDACCAGLLTGALLRWPIDQTLRLADTLGAYVASQPGATPRLPLEIIAMTTGREP